MQDRLLSFSFEDAEWSEPQRSERSEPQRSERSEPQRSERNEPEHPEQNELQHPEPQRSERSEPERPRRAALRLIEPELQLRLPLYLFGVTMAFAVLATLHSWYAYERLLNGVAAEPGYRELLAEQTATFLGMSFLLLVVYGVVLAGVCIAYLRTVLGPIVAFRRQIEALRRGDYTARNTLRAGSPFADLGGDLNELAQALEVRREMRLLHH
jgi:hypothetical protein